MNSHGLTKETLLAALPLVRAVAQMMGELLT